MIPGGWEEPRWIPPGMKGFGLGTSMSRVEGAMQARVMRIKKGSNESKTYRTLNPPNRMTESKLNHDGQ
jgi:hypothetical protein